MVRRCFAAVVVTVTHAALLLACGSAAENRGQTSSRSGPETNTTEEDSPNAVPLPSDALLRRIMKQTGADAEVVLRALYPIRDRLDAQGELSEADETMVRAQLKMIDAKAADNLARLHRNAMLDMERYIDRRTRGDCDGVSDDYGYTVNAPLQIGGAAGGNRLFMGAMICPENRLLKVGSRAIQPTKSYARPDQDHADMPLDVWTVLCGANVYKLYSDLYTRGRFCAPKGFEVVPLRALEAYNLSWAAFKEKKFADALTLANEAIRKGGSVGDFLEHRAFIEMELDQTNAARASFHAARKASPNHEGIALNWAGFEFENGTPRQADKALEVALKTISDDHKNYRIAWCLAAETKGKLSSRQARSRGKEMAKAGCAAQDEGNERCCKLTAALEAN